MDVSNRLNAFTRRPLPAGGLAGAGCLLIALSWPPTSSSDIFQRTDLPSPGGPAFVASRDVNGDGHPDLLVTKYNLSVSLGRGDGTFGLETYFPTGIQPVWMAIDYFNRDAYLDLAVANFSGGTISVLYGHGDGTFGANTDYQANLYTSAVAAGDLDSDGDLDLVAAAIGGAYVYLGCCNGTFLGPYRYLIGSLASIVLVDLNADGKLDAAGADASGYADILIGTGDGTFLAATRVPTVLGCNSIAAGDLNRDGKLDLATTSPYDNSFSVLLGNGDGTFRPAVNTPTGDGPVSIAMADVNRDSILDIALIDHFDQEVSLYLGNGNGSQRPPIKVPVGVSPYSMAVQDIDSDGWLDLLVANEGSNTISILRNTGDFSTPTLFSLASADVEAGLARLAWQVGDQGGPDFNVYRRGVLGYWVRMAQVQPDGTGRVSYEDRTVTPGQRYAYRLGMLERGGEVFSEEVWVEIPIVGVEIQSVRFDRAGPGFSVLFSLADGSTGRLKLADISGRVIASQAVGGPGSEPREVLLVPEGGLPAGIYFVVLREAGAMVTRKAVAVW